MSYLKYYNSVSPGYKELYGKEQLKKIKIIKKIIIDDVVNVNKKSRFNKNNNIKDNKNKIKNINHYTILDVGCGTGLSKVISKNVIGVDPSIGLLKKAKIRRVNGVAESLPFKDDVFDIVVSVTAIHNFSNIKKAIEEMKRIVKSKKGYLIISVLKKSAKFRYIKNMLNKNFRVKGVVEEEKDVVFFCERKV